MEDKIRDVFVVWAIVTGVSLDLRHEVLMRSRRALMAAHADDRGQTVASAGAPLLRGD